MFELGVSVGVYVNNNDDDTGRRDITVALHTNPYEKYLKLHSHKLIFFQCLTHFTEFNTSVTYGIFLFYTEERWIKNPLLFHHNTKKIFFPSHLVLSFFMRVERKKWKKRNNQSMPISERTIKKNTIAKLKIQFSRNLDASFPFLVYVSGTKRKYSYVQALGVSPNGDIFREVSHNCSVHCQYEAHHSSCIFLTNTPWANWL